MLRPKCDVRGIAQLLDLIGRNKVSQYTSNYQKYTNHYDLLLFFSHTISFFHLAAARIASGTQGLRLSRNLSSFPFSAAD